MDISGMISEGVKFMGIGVGVVFVVLGLFFVIMKVMMKLWPAKEDKES